ncbi:MAG: c-type cytochrome [Kiloniellales bacterium]
MTVARTRSRRALIGLAAAAAVITGVAAAQAADDPANVVKYRGMVMSALGAHIGSIASVIKGEVSYGPHVSTHAQALHATSLMLTDVFPEGSGVGETRAKPEIWQEWEKFEGLINDLSTQTEKLAQVAEGGDMAAIGAQLQETGKACGNCHKPYREEKE